MPEEEPLRITQAELEAFAFRDEPSLEQEIARWHSSDHKAYADAINALRPHLPPKKSLKW